MIMSPNTRPLGEQVLFLLLVPPIIAICCWVASRGLATAIQGGSVSETTKGRQKREFWAVLAGMYVIAIGMFIYAHFIMPH
jgi:hypothetical protein